MAPLRVSINPGLKPGEEFGPSIVNGVENALCQLLLSAYKCHLIPVITPDDIYLQILSILAKHVNKNPMMVDHYRPFLADPSDPNNKTVIVIRRGDDFDLNNQEHVGSVFRELMTKVCKKSSGSELLSKLQADFTTTTDITSLVSQVTLAYMVNEFFAMRLLAMCDWRAIDLAGSVEDWMSMKTKLEAFEQIAHPSIKEYLKKCHKSLDIIVQAFKGQVDIQTWENCFVSKWCGSGSIEWSGFLTEFFNPTRNWSPRDQVSSRVVYDFGLSDPRGSRNVSISAGPTGVKPSSEGTLSIEYDFFIEPSKAKGFTVDSEPVQFFSELDFAQGPAYYSRVRFEGQSLHFYIDYQSFAIVYYKPTKTMLLASDDIDPDDPDDINGREYAQKIKDFASGRVWTDWAGDFCLGFQATKVAGLTSKSQKNIPKHIKQFPFVESDWVVLYKKVDG